MIWYLSAPYTVNRQTPYTWTKVSKFINHVEFCVGLITFG